MKYSILMSVYYKEHPHYLSQAIESLFQSNEVIPHEIVIVKDGRLTMELDKVLYEAKEKYKAILIVGYDSNKGLGKALQYGLTRCSNEIVFRMDTDDIVVKGRFEKQLAFMLKYDLDLCGGQIEEFASEPGDLKVYRRVPKNPQPHNFKKRNPFNHMTVSYRKSKVIEVGGYEDIPGYEDYYLWLKLLKGGARMKNMDEVLVHARTGNGLMQRRRGYAFFKKERNFQRAALNLGVWGYTTFIRNTAVRALPRLMPPSMVQLIYQIHLRK